MIVATNKPCLAVVSPFLDKRHGTERRVVEWVSQLAGEFEIHVYSQRVEGIDLSSFTWHHVPKLPGPDLRISSGGFCQPLMARRDHWFRGLVTISSSARAQIA